MNPCAFPNCGCQEDQRCPSAGDVFETPAVLVDGWTEWQTPIMNGYRVKCCDCGLVHEAEFRIYRVDERVGSETFGPEMPADDYRVQLRMRRDR